MLNYVGGLMLPENIIKWKHFERENEIYMDSETNIGASSSDQIKRIQLKEIIRDEHFLYCSTRIELVSDMRVLLLFVHRMRGFLAKIQDKNKYTK